MKQALYRKYRSKKLSEIVGQEHITSSLDSAIKKGRISHAYLFTGPRGVGKTSIARILAHQINELPYENDKEHLDIIEIDAASNRRIDEIRDLRDKVHIAPTSAKFKVYIIDEVHMLTKEAFNALLKTLEEPPSHVVFILATTESHKLPETIISRTQRFHFKPVQEDKVAGHIMEIAKSEGFEIEPEAADLIAKYGEGSFRDSISLLDQLAGLGKKINQQDVRDLTGYTTESTLLKILQAISQKDTRTTLELIESVNKEGVGAKQLSQQLIRIILDQAKTSDLSIDKLSLARDLLCVESSNQPESQLEVILIEQSLAKNKSQKVVTTETPTTEVSQKKKNQPNLIAKKEKPTKQSPIKLEADKPMDAKVSNQTISKSFDDEDWKKVLSAVKSTNPSLYSILRMASPNISNDVLELKFKHSFHAKKLKEQKNLTLIKSILDNSGLKNTPINSVHDPNATALTLPDIPMRDDSSLERVMESATGAENDKTIETIMKTFGGGEVIEA